MPTMAPFFSLMGSLVIFPYGNAYPIVTPLEWWHMFQEFLFPWTLAALVTPSVVTFSLLTCTGILTVPDNLDTCNPGMVVALFNLTGALMFMTGDSVLSTASRHRTMLPIDPLLQAAGKFLISSNVALSRIMLMCSVPKRTGILAPYSVSLTTSNENIFIKALDFRYLKSTFSIP